MGQIAKMIKTFEFLKVFHDSGRLVWLVEASCALFWAMLAPRSPFEAHLEASLRHVGAKMSAKSAKMNQHKRKSAPRSMQRA